MKRTPEAVVIWRNQIIGLDIDMHQIDNAGEGDEIRAQVRFIRPLRNEPSGPSRARRGASERS